MYMAHASSPCIKTPAQGLVQWFDMLYSSTSSCIPYWNLRIHLSKNKKIVCIPCQYILEMVDHPIIISVPTWTTNEMQLIARIYVKQDMLLKSKLLHYTIRAMYLNKLKNLRGTIVIHKSITNMHITGATDVSSSK